MPRQSTTGPDAFSADEIRRATFVRSVEIHDTLDSTNNRAAQLARDANIDLPALVVARLQTAGRGRGTRKWWSADGALTFSLLVDSAANGIEVANWPRLSLAMAVAVCDAVAWRMELGTGRNTVTSTPCSLLPARCSIKWPNDVLIDGRKIAGILLESPAGVGPVKNRLIVGIGVNVNNSWRHAPPDAPANGIALCDILGRQLDLQQFLATLLASIADRVHQLRSGDEGLVRAWQRLNHLTGQDVVVETDKEFVTGRCIELAEDGGLVLVTPHGPRHFFSGSARLAS